VQRTNPADVPIGRIAGLFGIHGEMKCDPTGSGRSVFAAGLCVRCEGVPDIDEVHVKTVREHKHRLLIVLDEAPNAESAHRFIGATLFAPRDAIALEAGEYFDDDLVGCAVRGADGRVYGSVERVEHYPASDMLIVRGQMLPMVQAFIRSIDVEAKTIVVDDIPPGLLD
jgi:16S rRNA processing protein RimM